MARLTIAHKSEASFRNRQGLRRALVKKLPKGTVGVATERKLLDSDCESCKSRRGKATTSAAKAALAYAKKVRNKLEKMAHLPLMSEDEEDDETEVEVEEEDPDADHVPLGGRGPEDPPDGAGGVEGRVGTVFSLEGGGSVRSRKHPTMEVILDSGASHNVLPESVFWRLYEQGRATPLKKVSFPRRFSTASGESLSNLGTTEVYLSGTSPEGAVSRCKCSFNVAAVQRCLLSTGRAMAQGNALVFMGALPPGREVLALSGAGKPAYRFPGASFAPSPAADSVRPAPREFKPTTAFLRALERLSIPKGWPSLHLLEENLQERSRSCRAVAFHLEQSHFGTVEKKAESACSRETLTPVGLGGSVEGEERGRKEKKEGGKEIQPLS